MEKIILSMAVRKGVKRVPVSLGLVLALTFLHREAAASPGVPAQAARADLDESVDDDEHLAAYNAYLARLNEQPDR